MVRGMKVGKYKGELFAVGIRPKGDIELWTECFSKSIKFNMFWEDIIGVWSIIVPSSDVRIFDSEKMKYVSRFFVKYKDDWFRVWGETETHYKIVSWSRRMITEYKMPWDDKWEGRENDHERGYLWVKKDEVLPIDKVSAWTVCQFRYPANNVYEIIDKNGSEVQIQMHPDCLDYDSKRKEYFFDKFELYRRIKSLKTDHNLNSDKIMVSGQSDLLIWVPREKLFIFGEDEGIIRL